MTATYNDLTSHFNFFFSNLDNMKMSYFEILQSIGILHTWIFLRLNAGN